jgi:hypothetical protein
VHVVFQGNALLKPESIGGVNGHQSLKPPVARTASVRVKHGAVAFDEDQLPTLRCAFVHRQQLAHTCMVLSVINTSWTTLDSTGEFQLRIDRIHRLRACLSLLLSADETCADGQLACVWSLPLHFPAPYLGLA